MAVLDESRVRQELASLPGWSYEDNSITTQRKFAAFLEGIDFVNRVARLAEEANHHPDISINYTRVRLTLSTHSEGGVTEKDLELARRISAV